MADVIYKGANAPTIQGVGTEGIVDSKQQANLFEGILNTTKTAVEIGNNVANTLIAQEEKIAKQNEYKDLLLGQRDLFDYENSLSDMTGAEKETSVNAKFAELMASNASEAYKKGFGAKLPSIHEKAREQRIQEDTYSAGNLALETVKNEMNIRPLNKDYIENLITDIKENVYPDAEASVIRNYAVSGLVSYKIDNINKDNEKTSEIFYNEIDENTGIVSTKKVNIVEPSVTIDDVRIQKQTAINELNEMLSSVKLLLTKSPKAQKELQSELKRLKDAYDLKEKEISKYSQEFINKIENYDVGGFNSYSVEPEQMDIHFRNSSYIDGSFSETDYNKKRNKYISQYNTRQKQMSYIVNADENIMLGKLPSKDEKFAYDFIQNKNVSDFNGYFNGNESLTSILKYKNVPELYKENLNSVVKRIQSTTDATKRVELLTKFENLQNNLETNNMVKNQISNGDIVSLNSQLKASKLLEQGLLNQEQFVKLTDDINTQKGKLTQEQLKDYSYRYNLDEYTPEEREYFSKLAIAFENNYMGQEFKNIMDEFKTKNTMEYNGIDFKTNSSDLIIEGYTNEKTIEEIKNGIAYEIKSIANELGIDNFSVKVNPVINGDQKLQIIDEYGQPKATLNKSNMIDNYNYNKKLKADRTEEQFTTTEKVIDTLKSKGEEVFQSVSVVFGTSFKGYRALAYRIANSFTGTESSKQEDKINLFSDQISRYNNNKYISEITNEFKSKSTKFGGKYKSTTEQYYNYLTNKLNNYDYINKRTKEIQLQEAKVTNKFRSLNEIESEVKQEREEILRLYRELMNK